MKISCGTCRNIKMPERRSLMKYTKEDILRIADEENVSFIRLQFTDILGSLKNVAITRSQLEKALNNKCMFDGSSIEGFVRIEESDMYLHPIPLLSSRGAPPRITRSRALSVTSIARTALPLRATRAMSCAAR